MNDSNDLIAVHPVEALPCQHKAEVTVKAAMVDKTLSRITGEYRRQAQLPGFRPGKAPLPFVRKRFANEIAERAREMLMQDGCQKAMQDCEGTVQSMPSLVDELPDVESKKDFHFAIVFDLAPEFELPEVEGIAVECPDVSVRDSDVSEAIDTMRSHHATYEEAKRPVQKGDIVKVKLQATAEVDGDGESDDLPSSEEYVQVGEREGYEGIGEALMGHNPGDTVNADLKSPAHGSEGYAGRTFSYEISIESITETCLPELTDEWATENFEGKTVAELEQEVRGELATRIERNQRQACERGICDHLLEKCEFPVPPNELHEETMGILQQIHNRHHGHHNHDHDDGECDFQKDIAKYEDDAKVTALKNLRLRYMFQRIAAEKELQPDEEEMRQTMMMAMMQAKKEDQEVDPRALMHNVQQNMLISAAVEFLIEKASVTYVELPEESEEED